MPARRFRWRSGKSNTARALTVTAPSAVLALANTYIANVAPGGTSTTADLASPSYSVRADGAHHQRREVPRGELSIAPVADERLCRVTGLVEAS